MHSKRGRKKNDKQKPIEGRGKNQSGDTVYLYKNLLKNGNLLYSTIGTIIQHC